MDGREYGRLCREDITRTVRCCRRSLEDPSLREIKNILRDASDEVSGRLMTVVIRIWFC